MKYIFLALCIISLSACGEDAFQRRRTINVSYTPKLVAYGLLYANEGALVKINRTFAAAGEGSPDYSNYYSENSPFNINNAVVTLITEQNIPFVLPYNTNLEAYYNPSFIPELGKTYRLQVQATGFTSLSASTTVPATSVSIKNIQPQADNSLKFTLVDAANTKDYYSLFCDNVMYRENGFGNVCNFYSKDPFLNQFALGSEEFSIEGSSGGKYYSKGAFFADDNINGEETTLSVKPSTSDDFYFAKISEIVYRYQGAYFDQQANRENPLGEPSDIPTNITNGLGYFGAIVPFMLQESNEPMFREQRMKRYAQNMP